MPSLSNGTWHTAVLSRLQSATSPTWHVPLEEADEAAQRAPVRDLVLMLRADGHEPHDEAGLLLDLLPTMQPVARGLKAFPDTIEHDPTDLPESQITSNQCQDRTKTRQVALRHDCGLLPCCTPCALWQGL